VSKLIDTLPDAICRLALGGYRFEKPEQQRRLAN
jgi:hypothetical protein